MYCAVQWLQQQNIRPDKMTAFIAKQFVGKKLESVKGECSCLSMIFSGGRYYQWAYNSQYSYSIYFKLNFISSGTSVET